MGLNYELLQSRMTSASGKLPCKLLGEPKWATGFGLGAIRHLLCISAPGRGGEGRKDGGGWTMRGTLGIRSCLGISTGGAWVMLSPLMLVSMRNKAKSHLFFEQKCAECWPWQKLRNWK